MKKYYKLLAILAAFLFITALSVIAQQGGDETAKDPICGMAVKIAGAKITAEFQGKTFYFCSEGCKKEFLKDPAKYAAAAAEVPKAEDSEGGCGMGCHGCPGMMAKMQTMPPTDAQKEMMKMHGEMMPECPMMKHAQMPCCPMMMHFHMGMHHDMRMGRGMGHMGMMMGHGMASECPMRAMKSAGLETVVENVKDGVIVKITAKDAEKVKMIQDKWARKKAPCDPALCPMKKKAEAEKKEAEKK